MVQDHIEELKKIFLEEAKDLLSGAEDCLLNLEEKGFEESVVNRVFRLAHNFKGSSKTSGFKELGELAHKYEDILSEVKSMKIDLNQDVISMLLKANDFLLQSVLSYQKDPDYKPMIDDEVRKLDFFLSKKKSEYHQKIESQGGLHLFDENDEISTSSIKSFNHNHEKNKNQKNLSVQNNEEHLKIPSKRLDSLINIIGEIVVNQSILNESRYMNSSSQGKLDQTISYMSKLVSDLQNISLSMRLVSVKPLFQKMKRTIRDASESLKKEIDFQEEGADSEVDKTILEKIIDPLNHMIRNSCDHGIESIEERLKKGKPQKGKILLKFDILEDHIKIMIEDDGKGLDKEKILKKALEKGLVKDPNISDSEIYSLIFASGLSTKEQVTDVSGRGVGMDVVQKSIEELNGSIQIETQKDKGSKFIISLPLSLSIIGGMIVESNNHTFVIPISQMVETIELSKFPVESITSNGRLLNLRGSVMPINSLDEVLFKKSSSQKKGRRPAIIIIAKGKRIGLEVDRILSQQKVVLKKLGKEFKDIPGVFAGAVLSNGYPSLVLNMEEIGEYL